MKVKWFILALIVLISFGLRIMEYHDTFSDDISYFNLRHSIMIKNNMMFSFYDNLSYGGREFYYPPLFYIIMALSLWLFNSLAVFIPQIIFSLIAVIIYFFVKDEKGGLFGASVFATMPFLAYHLSNNLFQMMISVPLMILSLYFFTKSDDYSITFYLISFILLVLTSPMAFLVVFTILLYMIIIRINGKTISEKEIELFFFSLFFSLWFYIILFKRALLQHGLKALSRNIPNELYAEVFKNFSAVSLVSIIGSFTMIIGAYMLYKSLVDFKRKDYYLISSGIIVSVLAMIFRIVTLEEGIVILSVFISITAGYFIKDFLRFIKKTKISKYGSLISVAIVVIVLSSNIAALKIKEPQLTYGEKKGFYSLRKITPEGSVIFAPYFYGNYISFYGYRKNVMDSVFSSDSERRLKDIEKAYKTPFETEALEIFDKYKATYLIDSGRIRKYYNITKINYVDDERCFKKIYDEEIKIYKIKCHIKKSKRK